VALLSPLFSNAQIQIGSNEVATMNKAGGISKADMEALKATTTLFTLQYKDYNDKVAYEKAIRAVWTITPFQIVRPDELGDYMKKKNYSIFSFGGFVTSRTGPSMTSIHIAYDLWMPEPKKNGKMDQKYFARVQIYPDNKTIYAAYSNKFKKQSDFSSTMLSFIYNEANIYSWGPGYIKGYLQLVNDRLSADDERGPFTEVEDNKALASLKTDTLYVPDYVKVKFNMMTGSEKEDDGADEDMKEAYPYPVKFLSAGELNNLILNGDKPIKYLVYIKSSTDKFINIYDSKNNKLIYAQYVPVSYNFKNKDLKKLARAID
jgi:hypothetical protein